MNSLVVLFSVMMLAGAKPAIPAVYTFPAPAVAIDPAAVAEQTRIALQSAPAIYKTNVIDSSIVPAPVAYSAPVAIAPASVSTQSRLDIKSSPAVVSTLATAPVAYNALAYGAPLTYGASIAYGAPLATAFAPSIYTPAVTAAITPTLMKTAMAPEAESVPAKEDSVNQALPVAPTETPEVAAARAAHLAVKALEESHQIQKRSAVIATSPVVTSYAAPLVTSYASSPVVYSSPIARITPVGVHTPILSGAYGIHPY